jgi:hypothetical protein
MNAAQFTKPSIKLKGRILYCKWTANRHWSDIPICKSMSHIIIIVGWKRFIVQKNKKINLNIAEFNNSIEGNKIAFKNV